jgi:hypothetical protein
MRQTVIERLEARRLEAYDHDYHGMLDCDGGLELKITEVEPGVLRLQFSFQHLIKKQDTGEKYGLIEGVAATEIRDPAISKESVGPDRMKFPQNIEKLIEGAYAQDVMLPVSHLASSMRLPIPLISPIDFSDLFRPRQDSRQTHLPEAET